MMDQQKPNRYFANAPNDDRTISEVGKAVVTLAIASWATFLGGYLSQGDQQWRATLAIPLVFSTIVLLVGIFLQVSYSANRPSARWRAVTWYGFVASGYASGLMLLGIIAYITGDRYAGHSLRAQLECLQKQNQATTMLINGMNDAQAEYHSCGDVSASRVVFIDLEMAEKRISREQHDLLVSKAIGICAAKKRTIDNIKGQATKLLQEKCG